MWFSLFHCNISDQKLFHVAELPINDLQSNKLHCLFAKQHLVLQNNQSFDAPTDQSFQMALLYLFRKSSAEVKEFCSQRFLSKIGYEKDGIILSKGRLIDGMNFVETGEFGDYNIGSLGIKVNTPVFVRFSPISYSIGQHIHWKVGQHRGIETTNRISLQHVTIIQGMNLYRELSNDCIRCHIKRKKFVEVPMGPVANEQLIIAPPFFVTMIDFFGPL